MVFGGGRGLERSIDFVTFCLKRRKGIVINANNSTTPQSCTERFLIVY